MPPLLSQVENMAIPQRFRNHLIRSISRFWGSRFWGSLFVGSLTLVLLSAVPALTAPVAPVASAQPMQVQVQPTNPQLGDTISVVVQLSTDSASPATAPTISMRQKSYPLFALAANRYRALLPTTPLDAPGALNLQVVAANQTQAVPLQLRDRDFPTQSIWLGDGGGPEGTDYEFDKVDAFKALVTPEKFWNGPFLRPSQGEISTIYGVQRYYNGEFAKDYYHRGVDYAAGTGDPVTAPAAGRVVLIGRVADGFELHGNTIGIDHGQGVSSIFLHLSRIDVKEGDRVQPGQRIGAIGSTGIATGPHLHWGLYVNGQAVDPVPWRYQGFE
jgi:murein DD-endopeptidase MepM/ murein hydrolase activator NlpD